ncbi:MAG: DEAD/DEAH box helicase [Pseudomonadota bacterium]
MSTPPFTLDPFQVQAIQALDAGQSVLVCAPTGTGKTVIADHMVAEALEAGRQVIYTAPIKALSNQKFRDYTRLHGEQQVGLVTGDLVIRREAPCLVMTTEILRNMLLVDEMPPGLRHVILDEIHFLDDRERGTTWEELLIYLPPHVQVLGLSATLSNAEDFAAWLGDVRGQPLAVIHEERRAVPLELHLFDRAGGLQEPAAYDQAFEKWKKQRKAERATERGGHRRPFRDRRSQHGRRGRDGDGDPSRAPDQPPTRHFDVFKAIERQLSPYLYFVFSRRLAETFAFGLAQRGPHLLDGHERRRCIAELDAFERDWGQSVLEPRLRRLYEQGVGFHHAGLHVQLKGLVERLYEQRLIRVLYTTSTFALGVNMPARTVVFDGLAKYDGRSVAPLTVREFMQMAGRAGRRGMDEVGHVVIRMDPWDYGQVRGLINGYRTAAPEKVHSAFNLSFYSVVHLLDRHPLERIRELVQRSFLAFEQSQRCDEADDGSARMESRLRHELRLAEGVPLPPPERMPPPLRKRARTLVRLKEKAISGRERCWLDLQRRVFFLQEIGYLDENLGFNAGARALLHLQIAEIFVAELFLAGVLEPLSPPRLFGLLCGIVQDLPRGTFLQAPVDDELRSLARAVTRVRVSAPVREAERITGLTTDFCPDLMPLGRMWAEGQPLARIGEAIESGTDITGDLVGAFRRARDLCAQLMGLWEGDDERVASLRDLLADTARDEVEVVG